MNIEEIEITIRADGKIQLHTSGFSGDACLEATEEIEKLLGNQILQRERTGETYSTNSLKSAEKIKIHA